MKMSKKLSFVLVVVSSILMAAGCQSKQSKPVEQVIEPTETKEAVETQKESPKIVLTKSVHDFGEVGPKSVQKADFEFINEGNAALLVKRIQSTCGCSKPTLIKEGKRHKMPLKEPVAFEPGQSGKVEVVYTAGRSKAKVSKNLYVHSNDPITPRAQMVIKAKTIVKVSVTPEKVELRLDQENAGMPELVVKSEDNKEFSIKSASVAGKTITIPIDSTKKATQFVLKPQVNIQKLTKRNAGVIQITTDHPQGGTMMVKYNAKPIYEVSNPRYILQKIEAGKPIFRENLIRSNYGSVAEIESITSRNGYMEIESQQQDGNHIKLKVKITPPDKSSSDRRYITDELKITLKDGHKLTIRCSGWFRLK